MKMNLPRTLKTEIFRKINLVDLYNVCQINAEIANICQADDLWKFKSTRDFPSWPNLNQTLSYSAWYQKLRNMRTLYLNKDTFVANNVIKAHPPLDCGHCVFYIDIYNDLYFYYENELPDFGSSYIFTNITLKPKFPNKIMSGLLDFHTQLDGFYSQDTIKFIICIKTNGDVYDLSSEAPYKIGSNAKSIISPNVITPVIQTLGSPDPIPDIIYHPGCLLLKRDNTLEWTFRTLDDDTVDSSSVHLKYHVIQACMAMKFGVIYFINDRYQLFKYIFTKNIKKLLDGVKCVTQTRYAMFYLDLDGYLWQDKTNYFSDIKFIDIQSDVDGYHLYLLDENTNLWVLPKAELHKNNMKLWATNVKSFVVFASVVIFR